MGGIGKRRNEGRRKGGGGVLPCIGEGEVGHHSNKCRSRDKGDVSRASTVRRCKGRRLCSLWWGRGEGGGGGGGGVGGRQCDQ